MNKSEKVVNEINQYIDHADETDFSKYTKLAEDYAECCRLLNTRISRACEHLHASNPCEALRQIETFRIIEEYSYLNFDRKEEWRDICRDLDLAIPETILEDKAQELVSLVELMLPMKQLLARHHILAMEGSLQDRLSVLYRIAAEDSLEDAWESMITEYEKERVTEILREIPPGKKIPISIEEAQDYLKELTNPARHNPAPKDLLARLQARIREIGQNSNLENLKQLALQLYEVYQQGDAVQVEKLLAGCSKLIKMVPSKDQIPPETRKMMSDALKWLEQVRENQKRQTSFQKSLSILESAIANEESTTEHLTAVASATAMAAQHCDEEIPEHLMRAYRLRVNSIEMQKHRRFVIRIAILCVSLFVIGGGIFIGTKYMLHSRDVEKTATAFAEIIGKYDGNSMPDPNALVQGRDFYTHLEKENKSICNSNSIQTLKKQLEKCEASEKERLQFFELESQKVETAFGQGNVLGESIDQLRAKAYTEQEKKTVTGFEKRRNQIESTAQRGRDEEYRAHVSQLSDIVKTLETGGEQQTEEEKIKLYANAKREISALEELSQNGEISKTLLTAAERLKNKINKLSDVMEEQKEISERFGNLTSAVGDFAQFKNELKEIRDKFPDSYIGQDFSFTLNSLTKLEAVSAWNHFVEEYGGNTFQWEKGTYLGLDNITSDMANLQEKISFLTDCDREVKISYAHIKALPSGGRQEILKELQSFLNLYQTDYWVWKKTDELSVQYYYFTGETSPLKETPNAHLHYVVDSRNSEKAILRKSLPEENDAVVQSPHSSYAASALRELENDEILNDRDLWLSAVEKILTPLFSQGKNDEFFDPVLKLLLQKEIVTILCKDPIFKKMFEERLMQTLNQATDINKDLNWYDPENKQLSELRHEAESIERQISESVNENTIRSIMTALQQELSSQPKELGPYEWIGWLSKSSETWKIEMENKEIPNGDLFVGSIQNGDVQMVQIGQKSQKGLNLSLNSETVGVYMGMPVFLHSMQENP